MPADVASDRSDQTENLRDTIAGGSTEKFLVTVIIPALNEAGNIGRLVAEVRATEIGRDNETRKGERITAQVIVVDNGSADATAQEAEDAGAQVIFEPRRGYGYACAAGVSASRSSILVFLDGDYSFLPADLPTVLRPILVGEADLVLGSRLRGLMEPGAMPPHQRFGNWLAALLMKRLYQLQISDLGPYRAVQRALLDSLNMQEMTYGWPTEMIVKAVRRQARIVEVPVRYHNRQAGKSKVSGTIRGTILAGWYILGVTLRYAWR